MKTQTTPIASAVEPLRADAVARARQEAADLVERTFVKLAEDPTYYAYPRNIYGKREYAIQHGRYRLLQSLTKAVHNNGVSSRDGFTQVRDEAKVAHFIDDSGEVASQQYTAFIQKLEYKVGAHTAATLTGGHVWGFSILHVTKADGSVEKWKTQQIINVSVLGKLFNQWPSRKVK